MSAKRQVARRPPPDRAADKPTEPWLARNLRGWPAGVLVLLLAGSAIVLGAPRAAEPVELPQPLIDGRALGAAMQQDDELARMAESAVLDVDVRAVGTELRRYNTAAARRQADDLVHARGRLMAATTRALARGERELLALRAYQSSRFIRELREWQRSGAESEELEQLGGDFLITMQRNGWCQGSDRRLDADERVLRAIYKKRWNDLTGADAGPFALSPDEDRVRFGFFLRHPWVDRDEPALRMPGDELRRQAERGRAQLETIGRIARIDPGYPADLARGIVFFRTQQFALSAEAFRRELDRSTDGPYRLRMQNHLKAALDRTSEGLF